MEYTYLLTTSQLLTAESKTRLVGTLDTLDRLAQEDKVRINVLCAPTHNIFTWVKKHMRRYPNIRINPQQATGSVSELAKLYKQLIILPV